MFKEVFVLPNKAFGCFSILFINKVPCHAFSMANKGTTEKAVADLDSKEVDFFVDQFAELLLRQVEEANGAEAPTNQQAEAISASSDQNLG